MTRTKESSLLQKVVGRGPTQLKLIETLMDAKEPIQQSELSRKSNVPEVTVKRIMMILSTDPNLRDIFKSEKRYSARLYWLNKDHPSIAKLRELRDILRRMEQK
jgi:hypothetical protein